MSIKTSKKTSAKNKPQLFSLRQFAFLTCFILSGLIMSLHAQDKTVSGKITDQTNEALIGVSVRIQGTTVGTVSDIDGMYSISTKQGDILEFSFVGMHTQLATVGTANTINIVLKDDVTTLTETVVIGYGSAKKRDLTGSIVSIKAEEIANRPSSNPLASLQGKIAGVQVVNTGRAGQDPEIRIRGTNSLNGYAPLYVVDGLMADNINYLNPADIESMDILKDPSSLAIFGVRGANGVIIVTTKRAKEGQTLVNINSSLGFKKINDRISMANAAQFKELYNEQLANQDAAPFDYTAWQADTNWQDEIFQTGFMTINNVSITGASEKNKFYLSVGYTSEEGSIKSEKYSKVTINLNSDYSVKPNLRFGYQVNGARTLPPDAKGVGAAVLAAPISPMYYQYTDPLTEKTETLIHTLPSFQRSQVWNPMIGVDLQGAHNKATNYRAVGNIYGEWDIMKELKFKATYSLDYGTTDSRIYSPIVNVYNPDLNKKEMIDEYERVTQAKSHSLVAQQEYLLTYDNKIGKHGLNAMAGITTNYRETSSITAGRSQKYGSFDFSIPNDDPNKWWISSINNAAMTNGSSQFRRFTMSYLLRTLYNYDNRYLLNLSFRRDGSSVFRNTGNTWDNFGSIGGGWIVTDEPFMKNQNVVEFLKLKASWGLLGSENTGGRNYPSYPTLDSSGSAVFGDNILTGYALQYLVQGIGWEKTYSWEAGFESLLLQNRLRIEPTYYSKRTKDILVITESIAGAQNQMQNLGEVENKGLELSVSWRDKIGATGITYSIGGNLTTVNNEVKKIDVEDTAAKLENGVSRTIKGEPIGYFYGYKVIGVYQNYEDIKLSEPNSLGTVRPGDLKFADIDGDGKITEKDRTKIGNPTPDFTYGLNFNVAYKGFDLGMDMMGAYGNEIYRKWDTSSFAQFNYLTSRTDRWHGEGTSNWEPILDPSRSINLLASNYFIEDGSFFRIRNLQLGYTFPQPLLDKVRLKSLRVYGNIQNLKTWSKNSGYTPEIGGSALSSGIDNGTYPMPAIYTLGVNLTF